jgi:uncharacterized protein YyaL (SSP411 family)
MPLVERFEISTSTDWNAAADAASRWCLTQLWDAEHKRFRPATPKGKDDLPFDFMWANGIAFSMLLGGVQFAPTFYRPYLQQFFEGLEGYWDTKANPNGYDAFLADSGDDKYYDDNAWMVLTFTEAYAHTRDARYLRRAEEAMRFVLSGWDETRGGGIYWRQKPRETKNTCSNGPSATAALKLARFSRKDDYAGWARRIVRWTQDTLQDKAGDGLYFDNIHVDSGKVEKTKWTYNTGLMLRAHLELWRRTKDKAHRAEAMRLAVASEKEFVRAETGAFRDEANFSHLLCEAFLDLWRETHENWLWERAQKNGQFALNHVRDRDGGFWTSWKPAPGQTETRKNLMANASTARLFWLLAEASAKPVHGA